MTPVSPVLSEEFKDIEVVYAKDQPEYLPLPAIRNSKGIVLSRWKLTDEERNAIHSGADLYLSVYTFNHPLQPVYLEVSSCGTDDITIAHRMELIPDEFVIVEDK